MAVSIFLLIAFIAVDNVALVFLARETLDGSALAYGVIEASSASACWSARFWILRGRGGAGWPRGSMSSPAASARRARSAARSHPASRRWRRSRRSPAPATGSRSIAMETIVQQRVPRGMIGRVYGFISSATSLGLGVAMGLGGLLVDATSPRAAFAVASVGGVLVDPRRRPHHAPRTGRPESRPCADDGALDITSTRSARCCSAPTRRRRWRRRRHRVGGAAAALRLARASRG